MSDDLCGQMLVGRYLLEELVGEGSMGCVYKGRAESGPNVAVKIMHGHLQKRQDFRERFELEAQALSRLSHQSFTQIHESGYDSDLDAYFMVLEFVEGVNAAKRMEAKVSLEDACAIALQVSEALAEAHSQGILHRDLKPENIMVSNDDPPVVKLLDLGLAKLFDTDPDETTEAVKRRRNLTKTGEVFGTPAYMSPEMCLGNRDISPASDLYCLGLILFELVEGHPPFSGSPVEVSLAQVEAAPPMMSATTPVDISRLVAWMLQKSPADRPQSANQVSEVLRKHVPSAAVPIPLPVEKMAVVDTIDPEQKESPRMNRLWFVGPLLVGALVIGWLVTR